jgi:hypothetical protein
MLLPVHTEARPWLGLEREGPMGMCNNIEQSWLEILERSERAEAHKRPVTGTRAETPLKGVVVLNGDRLETTPHSTHRD